MTPAAGRQAGDAHGADRNAGEFDDGVADGGEHSPHLPLAAFGDGEFHFGDGLIVDFGGRGPLAAQKDMVRGRGQTILQPHAARQYPQGFGRRHALDLCPVGFRDMMARVGHAVQEVAVIS